ncbi:hypothetical protein E3U43_002563 [Larimichthys crocea]|uniref:Uncharacterized protein n=1 Tax=Larimichthys crocea TaxID=215358 RepID=A0ACD3QTU7_LARCR|nr:hypothetical protein E3U43_002563 [Larimichthys crocea]
MQSERSEEENNKVIRLTEIRLLLAGWFLSGKTWVGDIILGIPLGERRRTYHSEVRQGQVGRWMVRLVDTPGWLRRSFPQRHSRDRKAGNNKRSFSLYSRASHHHPGGLHCRCFHQGSLELYQRAHESSWS